MGVGAPVLVVHGGPGFDHGYLLAPLVHLASRRRLVFYDQIGCGQTPAPFGGATPAATFAQARALLRLIAQGGQLGVIAHSWGALVLIAAYAGDTAATAPGLPLLTEGALVNPAAVTRKEWDAALQHLLARASPERIAEFGRLLAEGDGPGAMTAALPIYTRRGYATPPTPFPLNAATYLAVTGQLGDFDYRNGAQALTRLTVINGRDDFTSPDLIEPIARVSRTVLRPPVGHFPFFEAPAEFSALIDGLFP
jgi:proline iminopeptidase